MYNNQPPDSPNNQSAMNSAAPNTNPTNPVVPPNNAPSDSRVSGGSSVVPENAPETKLISVSNTAANGTIPNTETNVLALASEKLTSPEVVPSPPPAKATALVVEDNPDYRAIFQNILQLVGYEVRTAGNGEEALQIFQEQSFSLAFLDLQMPVVDGLTVLRKIRQKPEHDAMYVLIITANPHMTTEDTGDLADFVLLKPVNVLELAAMAKRFKNVPRNTRLQNSHRAV